MKIHRPIIGISLGDPFSIGPEITVKVLNNPYIYSICKPIVYGDLLCIKEALKITNINLIINPIKQVSEAKCEYGTIDLMNFDLIKSIGESKDSIIGGEASFQYVNRVIEDALANRIDATVTNAISKKAINMAGHNYAGHTEIYADLTKTKKYTMMLACGNLRVVHVSTHVSLRKACDLVKKERVLEVIEIANKGLIQLGISNPRIVVAALNPHAGENGLFGDEEINEINPAISQAIKEGINIPDKKAMPADSIFSKAIGGLYDVVVCMYHDEGHIPSKVAGFKYDNEKNIFKAVEGVNITLGLPIIRVSVDHGTAFDIAYKNKANSLSLENAIIEATKMANNKSVK